MRLDIESLRTFLTVLETGGMTSAADQLGVSQSAVSLRIRRLEDRIGTPVFVRQGHTLIATRTGAELVHYAESLVATHDDAVARIASSELSGTVRLGAGDERFAERVAALLGRFRHAHPQATVVSHIEQSRVLVDLVEKAQLDIAIVLVPSEEVRRSDHVLWSDDLVWIVGRDTYLGEGSFPLVTFAEGSLTRHLAETTLKAAGANYTRVFSGWSLESVSSAIRAGMGAALMNRRSVPEGGVEWDRGHEFPVETTVTLVVRGAPGEQSELARELIQELRRELSD